MRSSAALLLALLTTPATAGEVPLRELLTNDRYWPPACSEQACVLTGHGGIVDVWTTHVEAHSERRFVVEGICASACEIAYRRAVQLGARVEVRPGARLIHHAPTPLKLGRARPQERADASR